MRAFVCLFSLIFTIPLFSQEKKLLASDIQQFEATRLQVQKIWVERYDYNFREEEEENSKSIEKITFAIFNQGPRVLKKYWELHDFLCLKENLGLYDRDDVERFLSLDLLVWAQQNDSNIEAFKELFNFVVEERNFTEERAWDWIQFYKDRKNFSNFSKHYQEAYLYAGEVLNKETDKEKNEFAEEFIYRTTLKKSSKKRSSREGEQD